MSTIQIIDAISDNLDLAIAVQQGLFSALSGLCAAVGWTRASKVLGTLTALDLGRLVRYAKQAAEFRKAAATAAKSAVVLLALTACSGTPQQPLACPIPSGWVPASVASAAQAAQGVVTQAEAVAQDPSAAGAILVATKALDAVEGLCPVIGKDCLLTVGEARALLGKADAGREQACGALALVVALVPPEDIPPAVIVARELCQ